MAYQSSHTGPEVDAAVEMLSQVQEARDATAADRAEVQVDAQEVHANAVQVAAQTETVNNQAAAVQTLATEVEQAHFDTVTVAATAVQARDIAVSSASASQASQASANASEASATAAAEQASDAADIVSALAPQVSEDASNASDSADAAAASAASAAAVVTGGTATLTPSAGKIPLADGAGKIAEGWMPSSIARSDALAAAVQSAALATARTAPFLDPAASNPSTRFDGSPIQIGDRYFNTTAQGEYLYTSVGWVLNDATAAVDQVEQQVANLSTWIDGIDSEIDLINKSQRVENYAELSSYTGAADLFQVLASGIAGLFRKRTAGSGETGDGGTKIASSDGTQIFERIYSGPLNVQWFGASATGDSTSAFANAYAACVAGGEIEVPAPGPYTVGAVTGTKEVTWRVELNTANNLSLLNLPGTVLSMHNDSRMTWKAKSKPTDFANARFDRQANHAGGTVGAVSANVWAKTAVADGVTGFEWVNLNWLVNNGQGENCAGYDKADRYAGAKTGRGTFGRVVEARDYTGESDPTTALVAMEIDVFANGTDANNLRIGTDYVAGKGLPNGDTSQGGYAIRIGASNNDPTQGYFKTAILMQHRKQVGLRVIGATDAYSFESADTAVAAMKLGGTYSDSAQIIDGTAVVGTRYSGTFTNNNAIRFNSGMAIAWEATAQIRQLFGGGRMQFVNGGTEKTGFDTSTGAMFVVGTQVVGPRKTGWGTPTGTLSRAAYDTSSVTLATLAGFVGALITDLKAHGLMGA